MTGMPSPKLTSGSADDLYQGESGMLQTQRMIPLFQLPASYALNPTVQDLNQDRDGGWHLEDVWLGTDQP